MTWNRTSISIAIFVASLLLFVPFLGGSHLFDWDEVNFAEAAREMLVTGEFSYVQINFKPFWEKPPLFIWMQALSMSVFGVSEFAARLPNALCGAITLVVLFNIGAQLVSRNFGLLWTLVYVGSFLPQFYFRSGIIDPWFNLFIFLGIHQLIRATESRSLDRTRLGVSALLVGLAVLTKGPTALGLVGICSAIYFFVSYKAHSWKLSDAVVYLGIVILVGFSWFILEIVRGHGYVIQEAIDYHIRLLAQGEAGHAQPFFYHPLVLLIGCFPMSLFLVFRWVKNPEATGRVAHYGKWMTILFWVVLIVFSIVKTKIVHYSSLTYFPMSFLVAWFIHQAVEKNMRFKLWQQVLMMAFVLILGTAFILVGVLETIRPHLLPLLMNDGLAHGNFSRSVPDGDLDVLIGIFFILASTGSILLLNRSKHAITALFTTSLITVTLLSVAIAPKMDHYLQAPLFEFYKEKGGANYLQPLGFHSYAHLYYGSRKPKSVSEPDDETKWMLFDQVDRPVYFISRSQDLETNLRYFPHLKETHRKGGYVILERTDEAYPFLGLP